MNITNYFFKGNQDLGDFIKKIKRDAKTRISVTGKHNDYFYWITIINNHYDFDGISIDNRENLKHLTEIDANEFLNLYGNELYQSYINKSIQTQIYSII